MNNSVYWLHLETTPIWFSFQFPLKSTSNRYVTMQFDRAVFDSRTIAFFTLLLLRDNCEQEKCQALNMCYMESKINGNIHTIIMLGSKSGKGLDECYMNLLLQVPNRVWVVYNSDLTFSRTSHLVGLYF